VGSTVGLCLGWARSGLLSLLRRPGGLTVGLGFILSLLSFLICLVLLRCFLVLLLNYVGICLQVRVLSLSFFCLILGGGWLLRSLDLLCYLTHLCFVLFGASYLGVPVLHGLRCTLFVERSRLLLDQLLRLLVIYFWVRFLLLSLVCLFILIALFLILPLFSSLLRLVLFPLLLLGR
jgi:hypothetical protein